MGFFWYRLAFNVISAWSARQQVIAFSGSIRNREIDADVKERQLLIDVSVIINHDARTGIQRVVRGIMMYLLASPPKGYCIRPIFATKRHGYRYASNFLNHPLKNNKNSKVQVNAGDIFLGLDLAAHLLPRYQTQLIDWKKKGVSVHIVVYDLLPLLHPEWFSNKTVKNFRRWIKTVAIFADSAVCISQCGKAELETMLAEKFGFTKDALPIGVIPLGVEIDESLPSHGLPENVDYILSVLEKKPTVLMVGTIEPRKGYGQVLDAFEKLWQEHHDINLVIVGRSGWKTESLQRRLRFHVQSEKRLWWLDDASDEFLKQLYTVVEGVLIASEGEGFGLPLMEAIGHNKPILIRDIPVFRESAGTAVTFFSNGSPDSLAISIANWLEQIQMGLTQSHKEPLPSWQDGVQKLLTCLSIA
ncbi:glycosyltransferase family 4 protein [Aquirhabdus parva]|uniref:Glycosyltransferase family 1 protein n=1 Tax=Aquirhabdus parva TaxID=2283318 RepID=A0A345P3V8_9GAMM|nr:glycosyltransferase family 1 protein [Aquirhabdus parva]AXI01967.1 glycosyltransferase family 1 protein [Aquirhabdus parva]